MLNLSFAPQFSFLKMLVLPAVFAGLAYHFGLAIAAIVFIVALPFILMPRGPSKGL